MIGKHILSIDQSTSATKAILFDEKGQVVHRCTRSHQQYYPQPGWVEHDPEELFINTLSVIEQLLQSVSQKQVPVALAITNQRETVVVWDRQTGKPIYNAVVWQCLRGSEICNKLVASGHQQTVQHKTGLIIDPYFSASGIQWILENVAGAREKAEKGLLAAGTIDSWLIWKFTQHQVHATDYTNASRTLLFNIHDLSWDSELLALFNIPRSLMPEVKTGDSVFGYTTANGLFSKPVSICGVMGDSHAALFAQHCFEPGLAKATYGTGSSVMMNIGTKVLPSPAGIVTSIGYALSNEVQYVFEGNIHCTGDTLKWLTDNLQLLSHPSESESLAQSIPDNGGVYLVPAFAGLGAPHWKSQARAMITGMTRGTGKAHIARAALESIAYQVSDLLSAMTKGSGTGLRELRVDGGPTRNRFLMQFQADMLQESISCSTVEEASAFGAAQLAFIGLGIVEGLSGLKDMPRSGASYQPQMDTEQRKHLVQGWQKAVKQVLVGAEE